MKKNRYHKRFPRGNTLDELRAQLLLGGGEVRTCGIIGADGKVRGAYWVEPMYAKWTGYERTERNAIVRWLKLRRKIPLAEANLRHSPRMYSTNIGRGNHGKV